MKTTFFIAAGALLAATAYWFWQSKKRGALNPQLQPKKENERHHLTNVFSKAKEVALGN